MKIPCIYRKVNPEWIRDFRLAHNNPPIGYFNPAYIAPNAYIEVEA